MAESQTSTNVIKFSVDYEVDFDSYHIKHDIKGASEPVNVFVSMMTVLKKIDEMIASSKGNGGKNKDLVSLKKTRRELEKISGFYAGIISTSIAKQ